MLPETMYWNSAIPLLSLLDQTKIPHSVEHVECRTYEEVARAIETMIVRGLWCGFGGCKITSMYWRRHPSPWCNSSDGGQSVLEFKTDGVRCCRSDSGIVIA